MKPYRHVAAHSDIIVKAVLCCAAVLIGFGTILFFVFALIPGALGGAEAILERDVAYEMYERTLSEPYVLPSQTAAAEEVFEQPVLTAAPTLFPRDAFTSVLRDNKNIIGRISIIPDIHYLVTQTTDNAFYLKHGYADEETKYGTIFLDYRNNAHTADLHRHYIIYGHHMKDGSMFAPLMAYKDETFFNEHRRFRFDTLYNDYQWEIFSAYITDTDFYYIETVFPTDDDWVSFLQTIQEKSLFQTDIQLDADDVVLTLSTCTYEFDDARFVIHARLIDPPQAPAQ